MSSDSIVFWAILALSIIPSICCWGLVHKEAQIRRREDHKYHARVSISQKWLNRWSLSSMIMFSAAITILPFKKINVLCKYIDVFYLTLYTTGKVVVSFYQIARLRFCFAADQIHSKKYGYSNTWFAVLYAHGIFLILFLVYWAYDLLFQTKWHFGYYICFGETSEIRIKILYPTVIGSYFLWDWIILICYIRKICQFYNSKINDKIDERIMTRMKFNLYKIAFLTTILEFLALCIILIKNLTLVNRIWFVPIIITFMDMIDMLTNVYIVYLMIDHNNDSYLAFIRKLSTIGLFCVCPSFIETTSIMEVEENTERSKQEKNTEGTVINTKSMQELPAPIPIELHESAPSIDVEESIRL